jgi:hypothetical protein
VTLSSGESVTNVALEADPSIPFGGCPDTSIIPPTPIVTMNGADPSVTVAIYDSYRLGGALHVLYRLFEVGYLEIGGGLAPWDDFTQQIVIPPSGQALPWGTDLDLGDAALVSDDGAFAYVWGCARLGSFLERGCDLARLDASGSIAIYAGLDRWIPGTDGARGAVVFSSGPWLSSVTHVNGALGHVFTNDYSSSLYVQTASDPTGPWSAQTNFANCDLPESDPKAFCGGPVVRNEIADPTMPGELPVTYSVGTTGMATSNTDDYWPRLTWIAVP